MSSDELKHTRGRSDDSPSLIDRLLFATFLTALAVLIFLAGAFVTLNENFPGPQITRAYVAGQALYSKYVLSQNLYSTDLWFPERSKKKGVTIDKPELLQPGVTLYTSGDAPSAYLIDEKGAVLHSWTKPFSEAFPTGSSGHADPQPDTHIYFRQAHVYPNGDLLVLYEGVGDTPYGYGLAKLDKDSNLLWHYPGFAHHQSAVAPDGKIYVITHEFVDDELYGFAHLPSPRLEDFLVVLSPDGEELKKIRLFTAIADSKYRQILYTISEFAKADPTHTNTVDYIDAEKAANFPFGKEGQVLLSFRELHTVAVLDPETGKIEWATRGPWLGQHDANVLSNGNIMLFDNFGNYRQPNGISRVIEFNPSTMEVVWQYGGTKEAPLDSTIRSDEQRLANGNTLITESNGGRIVEVTKDGDIAWEFVNPVRGGPDEDKIPIIAWAERLDPAKLDPLLLHSEQQRQPAQTRKEARP